MIKRKYLLLIAIAGFIITSDQASKIYVHTQFMLGESFNVISNYVDITYVRNTGAAFGIFRDSNENFRKIFFLSLPPLAVLFIVLLIRGLPEKELTQIIALSGVCGGAIGNYIDRLRFGYVIDFLDFHIKNKYTWPAFNVADMAIVTGVCLLLLIMVKQWNQERKEPNAKPKLEDV